MEVDEGEVFGGGEEEKEEVRKRKESGSDSMLEGNDWSGCGSGDRDEEKFSGVEEKGPDEDGKG